MYPIRNQIFNIRQDSVTKVLAVSPHSPHATRKMNKIRMSNESKFKNNKLYNYLSKKCFSNFLITWVDFSFFLCVIPFRFVKNKQDVNDDGNGKEIFSLVQNPVQMILCAISHFGSFMIYVGELREHWVSKGSNNPVQYLNTFMTIITVINFLVAINIFWRKSTLFHKIVENLVVRQRATFRYASSQGLVDDFEEKSMPKWIPLLIIFNYVFTAAIITPLVSTRLFQDPQSTLEKFENRIKYVYFLATEPPNYNDKENHNVTASSFLKLNLASLNLPALATFIVSFNGRMFVGFLTDALILSVAFSLCSPVQDVTKFIRDVMQNQWGQRNELVFGFKNVMEEYKSLQELSDLINQTLKNLFFTFILQGILFYSSNLKNLFSNSGMGTVYLGYFFCSFCFIFHVSAEACKQMDVFKIWLLDPKNRSKMSTLELFVITEQWKFNPVGLSGNGRFLINYALMASVCSTLMTYFVVTVQGD